MAPITKVMIVLLIISLSSTSIVLGNENCYISGTVNSETTLECQFEVLRTDVKMSLKIKLCRENPQMVAKIDIDALNVHLKHEGEVSITVPLTQLGSIMASVESNGGNDERVVVSVKPLNAITIPLFSQKIDTECNSFWYWINSQSVGVFVGIGVGALLMLICCCYCCCKCCKAFCKCCCSCCKKKQSGSVIIDQGGHQMTPAQSNLPYVKTKDLDGMA